MLHNLNNNQAPISTSQLPLGTDVQRPHCCGPPQSAPAFGMSTPAFGASTPAFGAASTPSPFGASSTPAFGQGGAFGTSTFGSSTPAFGAQSGSAPFGQQSSSAFGGGAFGNFGASSAAAFGQSSTPAFGGVPSCQALSHHSLFCECGLSAGTQGPAYFSVSRVIKIAEGVASPIRCSDLLRSGHPTAMCISKQMALDPGWLHGEFPWVHVLR